MDTDIYPIGSDVCLYPAFRTEMPKDVTHFVHDMQMHETYPMHAINWSSSSSFVLPFISCFGDMNLPIHHMPTNGLQPKISIWTNSGEAADGGVGAVKGIAELYKLLPPLFNTVHEQTQLDGHFVNLGFSGLF